MQWKSEAEIDELLCAFGPVFFCGVKWGALCSGVGSFFVARRLSGHMRRRVASHAAQQATAHSRASCAVNSGSSSSKFGKASPVGSSSNFAASSSSAAAAPEEGLAMKKLGLVKLFQEGMRLEPALAIAQVCTYTTVWLKLAKFVLASQREHEFYFDEEVVAGLRDTVKGDKNGEQMFTDYFDKELHESKRVVDSVDAALNAEAVALASAQGKAAGGKQDLYHHDGDDDTFVSEMERAAKCGHAAHQPTFWDGVAVGVYGSLGCATIPRYPPVMYTNLKAGRI